MNFKDILPQAQAGRETAVSKQRGAADPGAKDQGIYPNSDSSPACGRGAKGVQENRLLPVDVPLFQKGGRSAGSSSRQSQAD